MKQIELYGSLSVCFMSADARAAFLHFRFKRLSRMMVSNRPDYLWPQSFSLISFFKYHNLILGLFILPNKSIKKFKLTRNNFE